MISVVLTTHNEEHNIEACLQAVQKIVDEIIVVDGESTDDTVSKAKKLGAKVFQTTNKTNFHINKQLAIDKASGDLILQLDADEIVDEELATFITKLHQEYSEKKWLVTKDQPVAWWIKRKNYFLGTFMKKGGQYPDPVIRLFLKGRAELPQKDVHEQMKVDGEIGWAEGHLLHYGNPSFSDYLRKFNTYTSFKAEQLKEQGIMISLASSFKFLIWLPISTFFSLFFRHKGFVDTVAGFVFALFSGLHHSVAYLKLWELYQQKKQ